MSPSVGRQSRSTQADAHDETRYASAAVRPWARERLRGRGGAGGSGRAALGSVGSLPGLWQPGGLGEGLEASILLLH